MIAFLQLLLMMCSVGLLPIAFFHCCCADRHCVFYEDPFIYNRIPRDYVIESGSWTVTSGVLLTTEAGSLIRGKNVWSLPPYRPLDAASGAFNATVTIPSIAAGCEARLVVFWSSADEYYFGQITTDGTDGRLSLWTRTGGANSRQGLNAIIRGYDGTQSLTLRICCMSTLTSHLYVNAIIDGASYAVLRGGRTGFGTKTGVSTGTIAGTQTFDDLVIDAHGFDTDEGWDPNAGGVNYRDCPICESPDEGCAPFIKGTTPASLIIEITGSVTGGFCCGDITGYTAELTPTTGTITLYPTATTAQTECYFQGPDTGPCPPFIATRLAVYFHTGTSGGIYGIYMHAPWLTTPAFIPTDDQIDGSTIDQTYTADASLVNGLCHGTITVRIHAPGL